MRVVLLKGYKWFEDKERDSDKTLQEKTVDQQQGLRVPELKRISSWPAWYPYIWSLNKVLSWKYIKIWLIKQAFYSTNYNKKCYILHFSVHAMNLELNSFMDYCNKHSEKFKTKYYYCDRYLTTKIIALHSVVLFLLLLINALLRYIYDPRAYNSKCR